MSLSEKTLGEKVALGLTKVSQALRIHTRKTVSHRGLSHTQAQILEVLRANQHREVHLNEIAAELGISAGTASESVASLISKRFVKRRREEKDLRSIILSLTPKGEQEGRLKHRDDSAIQAAVSDLKEPELRHFYRTLVKLLRGFQAQGLIPWQRMCVNCDHFRPNTHPKSDKPHHCSFGDFAFADPELRLDCPTHKAADESQRDANWATFSKS